jgi:hypothetical protein
MKGEEADDIVEDINPPPLPTVRSVVRFSKTKSYYAACILDIDERVKERMPLEELREVSGQFILGFYMPPQLGMTFDYHGHVWQVVGVHESVKRYKEKGVRHLPVLRCEYIGSVEDEGW